MNNLNSVLIEGTIIKDPQLKIISHETGFGIFTITSIRQYRQDDSDASTEPESSYINIGIAGKLAEHFHWFENIGRVIRVVGRITQTHWNDIDGKDYSSIIIMAEHIEVCPIESFAINMEE
jgi:single-strand DNA-binding protein